jgi:hypothetical protein
MSAKTTSVRFTRGPEPAKPSGDAPRVDELDQVADLDATYRWPDAMFGTARQRMRHFAAAEMPDKHRAFYVTFVREPGVSFTPEGPEPPAPAAEPPQAPPPAPPAPPGTPEEGPQPVRAARGAPYAAAAAAVLPHPLAYHPGTLDRLQAALDARSPGRFVAADPDACFATLTSATVGAPRAWGSNVLKAPRVLHVVAGVPRQRMGAILAQFPQLTLPTAQAASGEGESLVEYASSSAGSVTAGRFGRWTDLTREALIGADAGAITAMHRLGIALDLDDVLITATESAAGGAVAFDADVPAQIRKAIAKVLANTASDDPGDLVVLAHPDDTHLLEDVTPTGGQSMGERFQRFSGALVYPSNSVTTGFVTVANLGVGARYFEARGLETLTDVAVKTNVETVGTFLIGGYGVTLTAGFAVKQDVVTP